jgi:multidrug efflux system outer membrane protein
MKHLLKQAMIVLAMAGLGGCTTLGPDYRRPPVDTPETWQTPLKEAGAVANLEWWKAFNDPALDELIQSALENNRDLRIAAARIREFAARVDIARSGLYPHLGYGASAARTQLSRNALGSPPAGVSRVGSDYQANLGIGWELDFWGKIQRGTEAAQANLLAVEYGRRALLLSLVSSVATSYIELLSLDRQLEIARDTLKRRAETVDLFKTQFEGGVVSELEVAQARAEYETTAILIPAIEQQIKVTEFNLSVLLGRNPGAISRGGNIDQMVLPKVPAAIPSQVLLQRPDILQAEQNLVSANALIGVARAAYFPSISLTGLLGLASAELSTLLDGASGLWNAGAAVAGPIFSGGALDAQLRASEEIQQQLLQSYLLSIQSAFSDVDKALVSAQKLREILQASRRQVKALKDYASFAQDRYDEGYVSYIEVLDSERRLFDAELEYTKRLGNSYVALVAIYKSMGGGWVTTAEAVANQVDFPAENAADTKQQQRRWDYPPMTKPALMQTP